MFLNFVHMYSLLFISISISLLTVSSRPVTTDPGVNIISIPFSKNVTLTSADGYKFEVRLQVAMQSDTMMQMIINGGLSDEIVLSFPNITGETMSKVLEYCNKHVYPESIRNNITTVDEMRAFDAQFVDVHYETLFNLFRAANELRIKKLSDVVGRRIGHMMLGKSVEEIHIMFNITENSCVDEG